MSTTVRHNLVLDSTWNPRWKPKSVKGERHEEPSNRRHSPYPVSGGSPHAQRRRVCIRLTTAANEFDAVTLRHAFHYAEGEPFAHATDTPMERMWRDENREVWQVVFAPRDPRIVYAFILRAGT